MSSIQDSRSLYEQDILLWSEDTVAKLKARNFDQLDFEHLIEEVEALGIAQKRELISRLIVLLEHLLKRLYVNLPNDYNGWEQTIRTQRGELEVLLDTVPSLSSRWGISFDKAWKIAFKNVRKEYPRVSLPEMWPYERSPEAILDRDFWLES
ncbi:DUF29 family protein [Synechococcales cyanobacterium C]|uniref:DUF29 family protein n=1 Tax=Petrachloros mirabilis ULC683 TaxID=2781853 RepID=A0A8K2A672_9CYAN|nr:DUF29 domain-containing protein [Petrachloros mirabilis]NCJ05124.1 DUF29 family protein [Petrachloros mirabilis ULC683]